MDRAPFKLAVAVGIAVALSATLAGAAMYKWVDENGRTVYGDTPPPGAKIERINANTAPADPDAARDMAKKDAEIKKRMQQRNDDEVKADKDRVQANLLRRQCQDAQGRIRSLREDANVYRYNAKGEKEILSTAAREEMVAQNQKIMRDLGCTPAISGPVTAAPSQ
jgi:hypothetical protein